MPKIDLEEIQRRLDENKPPLNESPQSEPLSASNLPPNHPLWELWQRMSEIYGHQWASQQGDEPNDTWLRGLGDLSPAQFGAGLRALLDRQDSWPPNLVEFRQLCTGYDPQAWERQAHRTVDRPALEDLTSKDRKLAERKAELAKLREETGL